MRIQPLVACLENVYGLLSVLDEVVSHALVCELAVSGESEDGEGGDLQEVLPGGDQDRPEGVWGACEPAEGLHLTLEKEPCLHC